MNPSSLKLRRTGKIALLFILTLMGVSALNGMERFITIKSCNVLYDEWYQKYAAKDIEKMDSKYRKNLLLKAFEDRDQLANSDILCFQEWDVTDKDHVLSDTLTKHDYAYVAVKYNSEDPDGLVIAWKKDMLQKDSEPTIYSFEDTRYSTMNNSGLGIALRHALTNKIIYVTSLHASYIYGYEKRYESVLKQLNTIKSDTQIKNSDAAFICGDFNYNVHSKNAKFYPNRELEQKDVQHSYAALLENQWNDAEKTELISRYPTAFGYTGFELLDYILFKGKGINSLIKSDSYPKNLKLLIKHMQPNENEGPAYDNYFSDHAILSATFDI